MFIKDWKKEVFTIPNLLSLFRLLLIPVYVVIYMHAKENADHYLAGGILAVSCLTDLIDGKIARQFHMQSTLGMILDPLADKATQFTLILCLAIRYSVLWSLVGLFVIKEGFQLIVGAITIKNGKILNGALMPGKICTTALFISLIILVVSSNPSQLLVRIFTAMDAAFLMFAFMAYFLAYFGKNKKIHTLDAE